MDADLGAKGGEDLIGRFDRREHDPGNAVLGEMGHVLDIVVCLSQVFAPTGFCNGKSEGGCVRGVSEKMREKDEGLPLSHCSRN